MDSTAEGVGASLGASDTPSSSLVLSHVAASSDGCLVFAAVDVGMADGVDDEAIELEASGVLLREVSAMMTILSVMSAGDNCAESDRYYFCRCCVMI